jgi:uncharacterized protein (TIGR02271 family)
VNSRESYREETGRGNVGLSGRSPSDQSGGGIGGFFRRVFGTDVDNYDHGTYSEVIRRGGAIVAVTTDEARQDRAAEILNNSGAVDVDRRVESWRQRGYTGYDASAQPYTEDEIARERQYYTKETGERTIPVVQEELRVGKRAVQRGGVRVYNRVREELVEQQVNLREEHVTVDRRKTDRPATEADLRPHDEVIEVTETAEEPVVDKRTRVVEEVVVGKKAKNRTETVRDTVRHSDVDVERLGADYTTDYDDDFRNDFKTRFGSVRSARYETYAPAYQYGYRMAGDERYRGRRWEEIEPTLRAEYERSYPQSKWEDIKDAVRYGWLKVTGRV